MFKGGASNPYDEIVAKATDENLTAENWELIITLCDKVVDERETGARNVIAALLKRLTHRNPNVQLYALSLAESLSKNCGIELHREIASRSFTQALEKLIADRTTHDKVRRRALGLIAIWAADFENNPNLGLISECYNNLKAKNYKFDQPAEAPPPQVDDELRRKEEEELQRVLEMSMHDKGGRSQWNDYMAASSSGAGGSRAGSSSNLNHAPPTRLDPAAVTTAHVSPSYGTEPQVSGAGASTTSPVSPINNVEASTVVAKPASPPPTVVTRVRAMHNFQATEPGELAFEKGDIIKVVDRNYKDWWRGQLRGRTGIFPVNYVEPLPDKTPADITREAEQEVAIFAEAANIDKLLNMLRSLDPAKDSLADNEEIQELYRSSMSLRPKIVKLIDRYNQKKAELVSMNESFIKAKTIFERMMEDSLARHTAEYGSVPVIQQPMQRPESRLHGQDFSNGRASVYGWNPAVYEQGVGYPQYAPQMYAQQPYPPLVDGAAYPGQPGVFSPYTGQNQSPQQPYVPQAGAVPQQQQPVQQVPPEQIQYGQPQGSGYQVPSSSTTGPIQPQPTHPNPQQPQHPQPINQSAAQSQSQGILDQGPPYDYDPNGQYPDPGAQAWAQYYAQGGTDPAGAVYFKFVPGITSPAAIDSRNAISQQAEGVESFSGASGNSQSQGQVLNGQINAYPQTYGAASATAVPTQVSGGQPVPQGQGYAPIITTSQNSQAPAQTAHSPQGVHSPGTQYPPNPYPNGYGVYPGQEVPPQSPVHRMQQQFSTMSVNESSTIGPSGLGGVTA